MAKRKKPEIADAEIVGLVEWLNEMSVRVFLVDETAARRYARIRHLLCELDHIKTTRQPRINQEPKPQT